MARITDAVLPGGGLCTPKGEWLSASPTGQTVNALFDADIRTDIRDGTCGNEAFAMWRGSCDEFTRSRKSGATGSN